MKTIFKTFVILTILSLVWLCLSCGSRKVNKEKTKEEIHVEQTDNSVITSNIDTFTKFNVVYKGQSITTENVFEPIDNTKEASIIDSNGKKTILNNSRKVIRNTVAKNNTVSDVQETQKQAVKEQKAVKQVNTSKKENSLKVIDKKQFNPMQLILFGIAFLIVVFLLWSAYRKYKNLPFVPKF